MKLRKWLILLGFIFFHQLVNAQTIFVSGHITKDTTWFADTVKVMGNITIDSGKTLIINKGTYIQSQDYYKFIINGCIKAIGTQSDTIFFTIKDTTGFGNHIDTTGSWGGFCFSNTPVTNDTSIFEYCKVQYCKKTSKKSKSGVAFYILNFSKLKISHCTIANNFSISNGGSMYILESNPVISHNTFNNNYSDSHGGAVCYVTNTIANTNFSDNILIYNYSYL